MGLGTYKLFRIWRDKKTGELSRSWMNENSESLPLVFDRDTKIIYYKYTEYMTAECGGCGQEYDEKIGFMTPYYSKHGRLCRFLENKIVEVH